MISDEVLVNGSMASSFVLLNCSARQTQMKLHLPILIFMKEYIMNERRKKLYDRKHQIHNILNDCLMNRYHMQISETDLFIYLS